MASSPKRKQVRALILIVVIMGAMWGFIGWKGYTPNLGLDLQGGISVVLAPKAGENADAGSLEKSVDIIRDRVDALGVAEPDITQQGGNILVQIAGIKETEQERAFDLIGRTAKLRFRPVLEALGPTPTEPEDRKKEKNLVDCANESTYPDDDPKKEVTFCIRKEGVPEQNWTRLRLGPAALEGTDVSGANAQLDPNTGTWLVSLNLTGEGARKFKDITGKLACNRGQGATDQLAIVLDRRIESNPQMGDEIQCNQGLSGGTAEITGTFTQDEAKDLALVLKYGALPIELEPTTTTTVSPTLGKESLRSGLYAALIGIAVVFLYVLFFYRALGLIIWVGIGVHAVITFGVIILLGQAAGFALSLAGIAGLIVSLGIAADSFIVYFERLKDEVVGGKTVRASVDRAWASARRTIVAADLVTALAALVLYFLAVGSVRGFALMLGLSTALDLFISYWFMHPSVWLLAQTKLLSESKTLGMNAVGGGVLQPGGSRA